MTFDFILFGTNVHVNHELERYLYLYTMSKSRRGGRSTNLTFTRATPKFLQEMKMKAAGLSAVQMGSGRDSDELGEYIEGQGDGGGDGEIDRDDEKPSVENPELLQEDEEVGPEGTVQAKIVFKRPVTGGAGKKRKGSDGFKEEDKAVMSEKGKKKKRKEEQKKKKLLSFDDEEDE